ncbi:MAG: acylneuraminate cytidylyltransferase family protein [Myxococcales bacterium]|nr:acylneuraminate cytidylyltransferase family protein [Myxococcales bacterium]
MSNLGYVLGVVHARGGSVRVPGKNLRPLGGRPLIAWILEAALSSRCDRVMVSTDCEQIASVARAAGADVPFFRPADLAKDVASELVTRHATEFWELHHGRTVDVAITLQPTTPFLRGCDIDACLAILERNPPLESAITATHVHQRPEWMYSMEGELSGRKLQGQATRGAAGISQQLRPLVHPNGGAYATRRRLLWEDGLLVSNTTGVHVMDRLHSVDIDEEIDFLLAESVARHLMRADSNPTCGGSYEPQNEAS